MTAYSNTKKIDPPGTSGSRNRDRTSLCSAVDLENGIKKSATTAPMTAEQILSQEVEMRPLRQLLPALSSVALMVFMVSLDLNILSVALPSIGTHFSAFNQIQLVFISYAISYNAFQVLSGFSANINMLIGCRAIAGIGAGPVLGGVFVDRIGWRWCFYIEVGLGLITIPSMALLLKLPKPTGDIMEKLACIDWLGTLLMAITTICLLLPTNLGGNLFAWNSPLIIAMYSLVVPFAIAFLYVEAKHAKQPIVPAHLWRNRNVTTLLLIDLFMGMTFWTLLFYLPIYFQIIQHETATAAGLNMIPLEVGIFIASNISGVLISKLGRFRPNLLLGSATTVLGICLTLFLAHSPSRVLHIAALLICGLGLGALVPCQIVAIQASVERKDVATVSVLHNLLRMTGSGLGVAVNGALFQNQLTRALAQACEMSGLPVEYAQIAKISAQKIMSIPLLHRGLVESIYLDSMKTVFMATIPMAALMFLLTLNVKHVQLNPKTVPSDDNPSEKQELDEL
ncbi:hypothetical protein BGZ72_000616 [Mortierella alpina]|nr:hypothetical protein BGZ72_000616 [Mortierella alpina]